MIQKINLKKALSFAWETFKKNFIYFGVAMIIYWALFVLQMVSYEEFQNRLIFGESVGGQVLLLLIACLLQFLVMITIIKIGLYYLNQKDSKQEEKIVVGLDVKLKKLFTSPKTLGMIYLHYLLASILFALIVFQGFMLLIIPGIYFTIKCIFYMFYIIDEKHDAIKALEQSYYGTSKKELSVLFTLFTLSALIMTCFLILAILFAILPEALAFILFIIVISIIFPINLLSLSWIYKKDIANE